VALLDSEIAEIKAELGFNLLTTGAIPYIATVVSAASSPTPVGLILASATGFAAGQRVVVDVDDFEETATVRSISGSTITVGLRLAHTAGYPVAVVCGETLVRQALRRIRAVKEELANTFGEGALKQVDEVQFYQVAGNQTAFGVLGVNLNYWRDELASRLGIASMWSMRQGAAQTLSVY